MKKIDLLAMAKEIVLHKSAVSISIVMSLIIVATILNFCNYETPSIERSIFIFLGCISLISSGYNIAMLIKRKEIEGLKNTLNDIIKYLKEKDKDL